MMSGAELARLLGPLVTIEGRERLASLARGATTDIALRYEWIKDWDKLGDLLIEHVDHIQLYDGQEWFTLDTAAP